ncbi:MAG: HAMP domain-containing protein [Lachnospiraceae bacterium]|nr:HAMP domain-containing protein [Lachnospiraceae bacterium]
MKRTIYTKFILGYILFGLLCILFINVWSANHIMEELKDSTIKTLYDDGNIILNQCLRNDFSRITTDDGVRSQLSIVATMSESRIRMINTDNTVVYDSDNPATNQKIANFDITAFGNKYYKTGNFFGEFNEDVISVVVPVVGEFKTDGYIILHVYERDLYPEYNHQLHIIYITLIVMLLFSLIILLIFNFVVYLPIKKISTAAHEYANGNFTYAGLSKFTSEDEIGRLGVSLNYMASKLNDMEEDQKKFVSNVSHDFRSPLTSIKGYIEAMKDGTIPYEMQPKYLDIVLFETERLTKLTQNLISLNKWDRKTSKLNLEDFYLYSLIKPIIATFGGKCEKKHITIDLTLESKDYIVLADKSKIEQVIYNLLDNAIKFSQNDSVISINITDKNDKIFISIKDSGIGIPKDSLNKIWDRFYKTDLSRGKDKTGTGLGLSIVREIIAAHDEYINVISTEGVGTEFTFTLKKSKLSPS